MRRWLRRLLKALLNVVKSILIRVFRRRQAADPVEETVYSNPDPVEEPVYSNPDPVEEYTDYEIMYLSLNEEEQFKFTEMYEELCSLIPKEYSFVYDNAEEVFRLRNVYIEDKGYYNSVIYSMSKLVRSAEKVAHELGNILEVKPLVRQMGALLLDYVRRYAPQAA